MIRNLQKNKSGLMMVSCSGRHPMVLRWWMLLAVLLFADQWERTNSQTCPVEGETPADMLGPFYVENSPLTTYLAPEDLLADPQKLLVVSGRVLSSRNCSVGVAGVTVEVWYAGEPDSAGNYYQNDEYRGQMVTDDCGYYDYQQIFPHQYPTRPILHNHFRLSKDGQELLVTQMYFIGDGDGYVSNTERSVQTVDIATSDDGTRIVEFDIFVDVDAVSSSACNGEEKDDNDAPVVAPSTTTTTTTNAPNSSPGPSNATTPTATSTNGNKNDTSGGDETTSTTENVTSSSAMLGPWISSAVASLLVGMINK